MPAVRLTGSPVTEWVAGLPAWIIAAASVVAAIVVLVTAGRRVVLGTHRAMTGLFRLGQDWSGEPDRPGRPGRPGVMQRLQTLEDGLDEVRRALRPNGGNSFYDQVEKKFRSEE